MSVIEKATNLLVFIRQITPELTKLFDKTGGDIAAARRDLQSLLPEIAQEELKIDQAIEEQGEQEKAQTPKRRRGRGRGGSNDADSSGRSDQ